MKGEQKMDEPFVVKWEKGQQGEYPVFSGVELTEYHSLSISIFDTGAGHLPVIYARDRQEFEKLICQIFYKGKKMELPKSMGAAMIKGWKDVMGTSHRVIILSDGYYSGITPKDMGLSALEWKEKSYIIRLHHEAAHYYMLRIHHFMNTALKDEFIADAMGIIAAFGSYKADYFLRFMGLSDYPIYSKGGRLENYLPKGMKEEQEDWQDTKVFAELKEKAVFLAKGLENWLEAHPGILETEEGKVELLEGLCRIEI